MIGWKPKPLIFIHIPKCAGTSIEHALVPYAACGKLPKDLSPEERSQFWLHGKAPLQHAKLCDFAPHYPLSEFYKFSFVRNPWDRAISQIEFLRHGREAKALFNRTSMKEDLRAYCETTRCVGAQDLGACQWDYLTDGSDELSLDFVGRFENLPGDFAHVCAALGLDAIPALPHLYHSRRPRHYSAYYDAESAQWIQDRFAKDIHHFGYKFESAGPPLVQDFEG